MKKLLKLICVFAVLPILMTITGCLPEEAPQDVSAPSVVQPVVEAPAPSDPPPSEPAPSDPVPPEPPPPSAATLEGGTWSGPCFVSSYPTKSMVSFSGGNFTDITSVDANQTDCANFSANSGYQVILRGSYSGINEVAGSYLKLNQTMTSMKAKVLDAGTAAFYNDIGECNKWDWVAGAEVSIPAGDEWYCMAMTEMWYQSFLVNTSFYDIYNINSSNQLQFGDSASGDKSTELNRPTNLNSAAEYTYVK